MHFLISHNEPSLSFTNPSHAELKTSISISKPHPFGKPEEGTEDQDVVARDRQ